jgi:PAS domain S-box-containing protein
VKSSNLSIRATLLLIIGTLNLLIALLVGVGVYRSWINYREAMTLQRSSAVLNTIYRAERYLSLERGDSVPILYTSAATKKNLLDDLNANRIAADSSMKQLFAELAGDRDPAVAGALKKVRAEYARFQGTRSRLDMALLQPKRARDTELSDSVFDQSTDLIMAVKQLIDACSLPVYSINSIVTQQMNFKYFVWEITEYAGREYTMLGKLIVENKAPTPALQEKLLNWRGRIEHLWEIIHVLIESSSLKPKVGSYMEEAETHYFMTFDQIKDMFYSSGTPSLNKTYPISIELWLELASQAVDSLLALKDASLQVTQNYVDQLARNAERQIFLNVMLFLCAGGLSLYTWQVIALRVVNPINEMVTALYMATRGEPYRHPRLSYKNDEIGKLALVLDAFQENTRKIQRTSRELEERKNYLDTVLSTMIDGIVAIDESGVIQLVNAALEKTFGYGQGELPGRNATILMPEATDVPPAAYLRPFMAVRDEKYAGRSREALGRRKDGQVFPIEMLVTEMKSGGVTYFLGTLRDITERKIAEEEHERYLKDLENSNRELDDFAYIASHDLKEPLRGLHNFSKFLLEDYADRLDDEGRNMLNTLASLTQQMESLLNALLHYSRLGRTELSIRETDLNQVVENVISMFSIKIKETNAAVRILKKLPTITCDHVRIAEVFQNLIGNALKYNDSKGIEVEIGYLDDHPAHPGETVYFVRDNGIGIAEKNLDAIFKIFHRLHPRNAYGGGTGSGLTIVKKIINQHNGVIWAESPGKDRGTTFFFTLPQGRA